MNKPRNERGRLCIAKKDKEQWIKLQGRQRPMGCRVGKERGVATRSAINEERASFLNTTGRTKTEPIKGIVCPWKIPAFRYDYYRLSRFDRSLSHLISIRQSVLRFLFVRSPRATSTSKQKCDYCRDEWVKKFPDIRYSRARLRTGLIS